MRAEDQARAQAQAREAARQEARRQRRQQAEAQALFTENERRAATELAADEVVVNAPDDVAEARRMDADRRAAEDGRRAADEAEARRFDRARREAEVAEARDRETADAWRREVAAARERDAAAARAAAAEAEEREFNADSDAMTRQLLAEDDARRAQGRAFLEQYDADNRDPFAAWLRELEEGTEADGELARCVAGGTEAQRRTAAHIVATYDQIIRSARQAPQFVALQKRMMQDSVRGAMEQRCPM
jgi:hypothetical protein